MPLTLDAYGVTDIGLTRERNEDTLLMALPLKLFLVSDGLGRHPRGDVASAMTVSGIKQYIDSHFIMPGASEEEIELVLVDTIDQELKPKPPQDPFSILNTAILTTNFSLFKKNMELGYMEGCGMGSTVAGLWFIEDNGLLFHVGDSRCYLWNGLNLRQLTKDHVHPGEGKPMLSQAMGCMVRIIPDIIPLTPQPGELYLLCTDGVTDMIPLEELEKLIMAHQRHPARQVVEAVVEAAKERGGMDNITVIVVTVMEVAQHLSSQQEFSPAPWSQSLYDKALRFAALAHQGQTLPDSSLPYLVHLSLVAMEVMTALSSEPHLIPDLAIQCALLHDVLEDTATDYSTLVEIFGEDVAQGVLALTKDATLEKSLRMADSLRRICNQPAEVAMVKLADRITNLSLPPISWGRDKIIHYQEEAKTILTTLSDSSPFLANRLEQRLRDYEPYSQTHDRT